MEDLNKAAEAAARAFRREACKIPPIVLEVLTYAKLSDALQSLNGRWLMTRDQSDALASGVRKFGSRVLMGIAWSTITRTGARSEKDPAVAAALEEALQAELGRVEAELREALAETVREADQLRQRNEEANEKILRSIHGD